MHFYMVGFILIWMLTLKTLNWNILIGCWIFFTSANGKLFPKLSHHVRGYENLCQEMVQRSCVKLHSRPLVPSERCVVTEFLLVRTWILLFVLIVLHNWITLFPGPPAILNNQSSCNSWYTWDSLRRQKSVTVIFISQRLPWSQTGNTPSFICWHLHSSSLSPSLSACVTKP